MDRESDRLTHRLNYQSHMGDWDALAARQYKSIVNRNNHIQLNKNKANRLVGNTHLYTFSFFTKHLKFTAVSSSN